MMFERVDDLEVIYADYSKSRNDVGPEQASPADHTTSIDTVFKTAELLEAILSLLSGRDLLIHAQRVCKRWNQTISDSPAIQTKLWLRPQTKGILSPDGLVTDNPKANDLLTDPEFNSAFYHSVVEHFPWYNRDIISHNPFFPIDNSEDGWDTPPCASPLAPTFREIGSPTPDLPIGQVYLVRSKHNHERDFEGVQPSWLDMYLTSPRVTGLWLGVDVAVSELGERHNIEVQVSLHKPAGATFRDVLDVIDAVRRSNGCRTADEAPEDRSEATTMVVFLVGR